MKQSSSNSATRPPGNASTNASPREGKKLEGSSDDFAADYRRLCQQLALAQERGYSSHLIDQLQQLAMRGHQQFYRHRSQLGSRILGFLLAGLPRLVREEWRSIAVASLLFYGSALLMGLLVYHFPDLIYSVVSPDKVSEMESMYAPETTRLGPLGHATPATTGKCSAYIMNNIGIAFQTFASGVLLGLGSLFFLLFNGLMIGSVAGHLTQIGYVQTFWPFVIGHGAFELTAITFAGAAGLARLGAARARSPDPRRSPAAGRPAQRATDRRGDRAVAAGGLHRGLLVFHQSFRAAGEVRGRRGPLAAGRQLLPVRRTEPPCA